jgi:hypothetical protein
LTILSLPLPLVWTIQFGLDTSEDNPNHANNEWIVGVSPSSSSASTSLFPILSSPFPSLLSLSPAPIFLFILTALETLPMADPLFSSSAARQRRPVPLLCNFGMLAHVAAQQLARPSRDHLCDRPTLRSHVYLAGLHQQPLAPLRRPFRPWPRDRSQ